MPCVEGELCLVKATTPAGRDDQGCQGKCGGWLHGVYGKVAEDNELHRICSKCSAKAGKRKAMTPEGAGTGQSKRQKTKEGSKSAPRKRLTTDQKVEILDLLEQRLSHEQIADRFGCAGEEDEKEEDDGDESTGRGRGAPPAYAELSPHFGVLESGGEWEWRRRLLPVESQDGDDRSAYRYANAPGRLERICGDGACWDGVRGGDTGRGKSKLVVFLLFFCRLVRTVSARA